MERSGKPLFPAAGEPTSWHPAETRTFGNGVVLLRHERARAGTPA